MKNFYGKKEKGGQEKSGQAPTSREAPQSGKEKSGQTQTPIISKSARASGALLFLEANKTSRHWPVHEEYRKKIHQQARWAQHRARRTVSLISNLKALPYTGVWERFLLHQTLKRRKIILLC